MLLALVAIATALSVITLVNTNIRKEKARGE
jgi:hypothetical protein